MDRAIADRAVRALAALNACRDAEIPPTPAQLTQPKEEKAEMPAACGSPICAGCYGVEPGKQIHPPRAGQDYLNWLARWESRGKVQ